jgi:hypothetical protein
MLVEALVYIGVLFILVGIGFTAMYRCIDNSVALRRSADDLISALHAGERWRGDLRSAGANVQVQTDDSGQVLLLRTPRGEIRYQFSTNSVSRRVGEGGWSVLLRNVRASRMLPDPRQNLTAWRWELELQPRAKSTRIRPLFTFVAVPHTATAP